MKDNLDIFIGAYKDFIPPVYDKAYKIIVGNHDLNIDTGLDIIKCGNGEDCLDDKFYSEIYMLSKLVENGYQFKEYVGFCHYRKYFSFMDDIPDFDELFKSFDCVVAKPMYFKNGNKSQYELAHNIEDLYIIGGIIADKYDEYIKAYKTMLNSKIFMPYNMFVMKKNDFFEYIKFVKGALDEYVNVVGKDIIKRIKGNYDKYLKKFYPNGTIGYQYRIGGYLAERLTNIFIIGKFSKVKAYPIEITEIKYKNLE